MEKIKKKLFLVAQSIEYFNGNELTERKNIQTNSYFLLVLKKKYTIMFCLLSKVEPKNKDNNGHGTIPQIKDESYVYLRHNIKKSKKIIKLRLAGKDLQWL